MTHARAAHAVAATLAAAVSLGAGQRAAPPPYEVAGRVPDRVDGQPFRTFSCDPGAGRVYLGSDRGVFWIDLADPTRIKGPAFRKDVYKIEFAENINRLFYYTDAEVGYVDAANLGSPVPLAVGLRALDLAYEPTRRELYVATRAPYLTVFDAASGERTRIPLPGWFASSLEAAPGRVYVNVSPKTPIYLVEAATHRVAPWPVVGALSTPGYLEADPAGRYLFVAYDRYVSAIDASTATVIGRIVAPRPISIAFDPGSRLLLASWEDSDLQPAEVVALRAYRVDAGGLTEVARLTNPANGFVGLEPAYRGFLQRGAASLIVWALREPAGAPAGSRPPPVPAPAPGRRSVR